MLMTTDRIPVLLLLRHRFLNLHDLQDFPKVRPSQPPRISFHLLDHWISLHHGYQGIRHRIEDDICGR